MKKLPPDIDEEDSRLWDEELKSVKKIKQPHSPQQPEIELPPVLPSIDYMHLPNNTSLPYLNTGDVYTMDRQTAKKFKRGEYKIEGELDLHGKDEEHAYQAVIKFITHSYLIGRRCVLIITGKGYHNRTENQTIYPYSKIKENTPIWLNSETLRPLILGFIHPSDKLGGTGALCVLLKKKK